MMHTQTVIHLYTLTHVYAHTHRHIHTLTQTDSPLGRHSTLALKEAEPISEISTVLLPAVGSGSRVMVAVLG